MCENNRLATVQGLTFASPYRVTSTMPFLGMLPERLNIVDQSFCYWDTDTVRRRLHERDAQFHQAWQWAKAHLLA